MNSDFEQSELKTIKQHPIALASKVVNKGELRNEEREDYGK